MMNPQKLTKWKKWLGDANTDGSIIHELMMLSLIREVHAGVDKMVKENPAIQVHSSFYQVFTLNYAHSVLMYIRRQVVPNRESSGLIELARDLRENHESITQDDHANLYARNWVDDVDLGYWTKLGRDTFAKHFGGASEKYLDPTIIDADINNLKEVSIMIAGFVDKRLAHLDPHKPDSVPSLDELEKACDTLNAILKKYVLLLMAEDLQISIIHQYDWRDIFRVPWLQDNKEVG